MSKKPRTVHLSDEAWDCLKSAATDDHRSISDHLELALLKLCKAAPAEKPADTRAVRAVPKPGR